MPETVPVEDGNSENSAAQDHDVAGRAQSLAHDDDRKDAQRGLDLSSIQDLHFPACEHIVEKAIIN